MQMKKGWHHIHFKFQSEFLAYSQAFTKNISIRFIFKIPSGGCANALNIKANLNFKSSFSHAFLSYCVLDIEKKIITN